MDEISQPYESYQQNREVVATENIRPNHGRITELFILVCLIILILEGIFSSYLGAALEEQRAWWTKITPWKLYPSELIFYNPIFIFVVVIILLKGRAGGYKTNRGIGLLIILMGLGITSSLHGLIAGAPGNLWLADLRQSVLGAFIVPLICVIAPRIRLNIILDRFCKIGVVLGLWNGIIGVNTFAGTIHDDSLLAASWRGEYVLLLVYVVLFTRALITGKKSLLSLLAVSFGIIAPLHKPTIATFVLLNLIVAGLILFLVNNISRKVYLRAINMIIVIGVFVVLMLPWIFSLGQGQAKAYFETKYLKLNTVDRDLSGRRFEIWKWGLDRWKEHPFFGIGFGFWVASPGTEGDIYTPIHNVLISWLYQTGIFGVSIILVITVLWLKRIMRFFKHCLLYTLDNDWGLLGMFGWVLTMLATTGYGVYIGASHINFLLFVCIGFLSDAEAQHFLFLKNNSD